MDWPRTISTHNSMTLAAPLPLWRPLLAAGFRALSTPKSSDLPLYREQSSSKEESPLSLSNPNSHSNNLEPSSPSSSIGRAHTAVLPRCVHGLHTSSIFLTTHWADGAHVAPVPYRAHQLHTAASIRCALGARVAPLSYFPHRPCAVVPILPRPPATCTELAQCSLPGAPVG